MTINLHDITGQESGIILVETDDGRHMNVVANWGDNDGLPYLFEPMLEPFSFVFLQPEDVHVETERIHSGMLNDEIAHDGFEDWNPLNDDLESDEPCDATRCRTAGLSSPRRNGTDEMKTRDILITVTRTLPGWHVYNDHQFGRITAYDPQARYEVVVGLPDIDTNTIRIVRTQYELVEDVTVLNTADMGEERVLDELARLLASPMPRTDRLMWLKEQFDKGAEWCRSTLHDEQEAKDTEDMAEHYMRVCESCNKYPELDPATVFERWLLGEELGNPYETRRQAASHMLGDVRRLDKE